MSKIQNKYFTTSEIAKICGVTKHTLFHYDEIGLLKPEYVHTNGYRYYSILQCYTLDIIDVLKKTGSSLKEIKTFLHNQSTDQFVHLIQQKQKDLKIELQRMLQMENLLEDALHMTEKAKTGLRSIPIEEYCEEEYYIATSIEENSDTDFALKLSEHRKYCEDHYIIHSFSAWTIMQRETFISGNYYPNYVANKIQEPIPGEKTIIKPTGLYAVMDHVGSYETMNTTYSRLKEFITSQNRRITGQVYEEDLLNYVTEKDHNNFIIRISVGIS
ncbi:MerR family transcriptional regulator [Paenibacillus urinalis]|uniref:MerR family transcriptional regulator n=1 Tax=Paenibacillus urinalis TaxID=521520 RepID=A0AAX3MST5_9BACL|nr:MerR family transcriptional regulator [Paenibacillus urinalis]WDH80676.1 MerR family transcriptional regulator [Paenibacillus urinalis]